MVRSTQGIKSFSENIRYAWQERNAPYTDNMALKARYLESRELYHEKMNSAFAHRTNNDLIKAFDELLCAVDYCDMSNLWEKS